MHLEIVQERTMIVGAITIITITPRKEKD